MPMLLKPLAAKGAFAPGSSVLFVACQVCPRMCLAVERGEPYLSMSRLLGEKDYFARFITDLRNELEVKEIRTQYFRAPVLQGMMCLWPEDLRRHLQRRASHYDAVAVIGCRSAVQTVSDALGSASGVVPMMEEQGVANFRSRVRFPFMVELQA